MNPQILHDTARRYLAERYTELAARYSRLPNHGRAADGYHYTDEAKAIFPRYGVVDAVLVEVERLDGDRLPGSSRLADLLVRAAGTAGPVFTDPAREIEAQAASEERDRFTRQVRVWAATADLRAEPVGYRRVLSEDEAARWRERLTARWGLVDLAWHPMIAADIPADVTIVQGEALWEEPVVDAFRHALDRLGVRRVIELREYGPEYAVEVNLTAPRYTGAEGVWSDESSSWIAYASHEGTVAFGGTLVPVLEQVWPGVNSRRWTP
ncbi:hypothetical protein ACFQO7_17075 [Catellatospora aurea]|uniref:Uncharacterized protein n=1 Tax=Catellatospora aurea TaxID=1337874 RepID=A0ABW2GXD8_9ACTN